ncbi:hypothetical protein R7127_00620 [Vibrio sp. 1159]|uniref:lipopolysaccharide biosynthesis protein n=1 Tax=Vibrio sp. 1159 TaxID=3074545 RepID=UPI002964F8B7|nr:hypothetical protein [Vibrio sp. 1159]MDW2318785.1 hypothetical protein [Vibrio sp. 1159]
MWRFFRHFLYIITGNVSQVISSFLIAAIVVNKYGMESYGKFVVVQSFFMIFPLVTRPLVWQAIVKFKNDYDINALFYYGLIKEVSIFLITSPIILALYLTLKNTIKIDYFIFEQQELFVLPLLFSFALNCGAVIGYFRAREQYLFVSIILMTSSITKLLAAYFINADIEELIIILCGIDGVVWFLSVCFLLFVKVGIKSVRGSKLQKLKKFNSYALWGNIHSLVDIPVVYLDRIVISMVFTVELAGVFNLIKRIGGMVKQLSEPVLQILFPKFIDHLKENSVDKIKNIANKIMLTAIAISIFVVIFGYVGFDYFDRLLFKSLLIDYKIHVILFGVLQAYAFAFIWVHPLCISLSAMKSVTAIIVLSNMVYLIVLMYSTERLGMYSLILSSLIQYTIVIISKLVIIRMKLKQTL